jgi:hypothetical protein
MPWTVPMPATRRRSVPAGRSPGTPDPAGRLAAVGVTTGAALLAAGLVAGLPAPLVTAVAVGLGLPGHRDHELGG